MSELNQILVFVAKKLNAAGVLWAVGGSFLLAQYKLVENPNDIDLIVAEKDIEKVTEILSSLGEELQIRQNPHFSTKHFYQYKIHGVSVDVISGFIINHEAGNYEHRFDPEAVVKTISINRENLPLTALEDWFVLYQLMPNKEDKVRKLEEFLAGNQLRCMQLKKALSMNLPATVKYRIEKLIKTGAC